MSDLEFEAKQIVRSFSEEAKWHVTRTGSHTEMADVLEGEATKSDVALAEQRKHWEGYYKPRPDSEQSEKQNLILRNQSDKLRDAVKKFMDVLPAEEKQGLVLKADNFDDIIALVQKIELGWEKKKQSGFLGKTKHYMHRIGRTASAHKSMLKIIPEGNEYVSIFSGALHVLLKAAETYDEIAQGLSKSLAILGDAIEACANDCKVYPTANIKQKVVEIDARVFLFLTEAIKWYTQKSRRRLLHSFNEDFYTQFQDQIEAIVQLSNSISREARLGQGAETRVIREDVESLHGGFSALGQDVRNLRVEMKMLLEERLHTQDEEQRDAELRYKEVQFQLEKAKKDLQDRELQIETMSRLTTVAMQMVGGLATNQLMQQYAHASLSTQSSSQGQLTAASDCSDPSDRSTGESLVQSIGVISLSTSGGTSNLRKDDVALHSRHLEDFFKRRQVLPVLDPDEQLFVERRIMSAVQEWMMKPNAPVFCVVGPTQHAEKVMTTLLAAKLVLTSRETGKVPIISYFCMLRKHNRDDLSLEEEAFIAMLYAMIRQLVELLPPEISSSVDLDQKRFKKLDGSMESWSTTKTLLQDLLGLAPPLLICVIDGYQWLDQKGLRWPLKEFLDIMRGDTPRAGRENQRMRKTLLTTAGHSRCLLKNLPSKDLIFADDKRSSFAPGSPRPGRTLIDMRTPTP